ncbi:MAG: hypothetical protein E7B11_21370 [Clostridiales bacterium]|nr:hypothetical protein [Clostridiales bacterium]MDU3243118.1 hypothetical protein [Clostridiales bacterium]
MMKKKFFLYICAGMCLLLAGCTANPSVQTETQAVSSPESAVPESAVPETRTLSAEAETHTLPPEVEAGTLPPEIETNPIFIHSDEAVKKPEKETEADIQASDGIDLNTPVTVTENQKRSVTYTVEKVETSKTSGTASADGTKSHASAFDVKTHSYVWVTLKVHNNDAGKIVEFQPEYRRIRFHLASDGTQPVRSIETSLQPEKGYYPIPAGEDQTFTLGYIVPDSLLSQMYLQTGGRYGYTEKCDMRFDFSEVYYLKLFD